MNLNRFARAYTFAALLTFNVIVLFLVLNLAAYAVVALKSRVTPENPVAQKYGWKEISLVHPGMTDSQVNELLQETWSRPFAFEPFTQFKERAYDGRYVNVHEAGFRLSSDQGPWPPDRTAFNIFLFGGSTAFGYGVADGETVASHLQRLLNADSAVRVSIYNFGRGFYYSSQERILLEKLLTTRVAPDLAIFADGLNEFYHPQDKPLFTDRLEVFVNAGGKAYARFEAGLIARLPAVRALRSAVQRAKGEDPSSAAVEPKRYDDPALLNGVIERYLANKRLIEAVASAHKIGLVFVWQPVPTYKYADSNHLFAGDGYGQHTYSRYGYEAMAVRARPDGMGKNFLWCADIQEGLREPLYVDQVHYTAKFSGQFASCIADHLRRNRLIQPRPGQSRAHE